MDELRCLFNAELVETDAGHAVEVPASEVETGHLEVGDVYRVALVGGERPAADEAAPSEPQPPVEEGELRYVEVEDMGDQGDGIARVERGRGGVLSQPVTPGRPRASPSRPRRRRPSAVRTARAYGRLWVR
jgi:hypothetical protein